ncbi:MAG: hypothetical protein D6766_11555 [Verrucomicrobia bacterium]|nr:MAG: hypothetical protein D6766_11555 [Verrucomicrobiota bacterium]
MVELIPMQPFRFSRHAGVWTFLALSLWVGVSIPVPARPQTPGHSTGTIVGQVIDTWEAAPLPGVTVTVRGTTLAATTGPDGRFEMRGVPAGTHAVAFARPGYTRVVVTDVLVAEGQTSHVDANLRPEFYELEEYVVTAPEMNEQTARLLELRQDSAAMIDSIGAEQFARLAASDAADIVERVPGITVSDGKNPVVRGLNERYVGVLLNGLEIPSADPYKKSAQLDMFPANMIEEVTVHKTFMPDMPGNFAGGGILLKTRSFPQEFTARVSGGLEVNDRTTLRNDFPTYSGGDTDWLAIDDGTRRLPGPLAAPDLNVPRAISNTGHPGGPKYDQRVAQAGELNRLTRLLGPTEFRPTTKLAPPNHDFAVSFGDTVAAGEGRVGYAGGLSYKHKYLLLEGENNRYAPGINQGIQPRKLFQDRTGQEDIQWAATANLAWRLNPSHELAFTFVHNQAADNVARTQTGSISDDPGLTFVQNRLHWIERQLQSFQWRGNHTLASLGDAELDWAAALSTTTQEEPDARFFNFRTDGTIYEPDHQSLPTPNKPTRYFRDLEEENRSGKVDLTLPLADWQGGTARLKFGGLLSSSERHFTDREVFYEGKYAPGDPFPFEGDPNAFFLPGSLGATAETNSNGAIRYTWNRYIQSRDSRYDGSQEIPAAYFMAELPIRPWLRLVGGVRWEQTRLQVDSVSYIANETTGLPENSSRLERTDWLPGVGLVWSIRKDMNVRVNYSHTIARPTFRELAAYRAYDPVTDEMLEGNPGLTMSDVDSYDLRWEWFPGAGEVMAVSLFYKDVLNAIERRFVNIGGEIVSYVNRPTAKVYGVEFELRRQLSVLWDGLEGFSAGVNAAFIQSEVGLTEPERFNRNQFLGDNRATRPLYDQSPYIINADLTYALEATGTEITLAFNVFGPRIVIAGLATPDVYEQPAPALDLIIRQQLGKHWSLRLTASNLLDPAWERTYGEDGRAAYSRYHRGRVFGISAAYSY